MRLRAGCSLLLLIKGSQGAFRALAVLCRMMLDGMEMGTYVRYHFLLLCSSILYFLEGVGVAFFPVLSHSL